MLCEGQQLAPLMWRSLGLESSLMLRSCCSWDAASQLCKGISGQASSGGLKRHWSVAKQSKCHVHTQSSPSRTLSASPGRAHGFQTWSYHMQSAAKRRGNNGRMHTIMCPLVCLETGHLRSSLSGLGWTRCLCWSSLQAYGHATGPPALTSTHLPPPGECKSSAVHTRMPPQAGLAFALWSLRSSHHHPPVSSSSSSSSRALVLAGVAVEVELRQSSSRGSFGWTCHCPGHQRHCTARP
mmetsp:Transcript_15788/g.42874  ORF Transcript_15788/g.42874 Transcript_15788/m.42874 type:complete len:239 (-) Transcript_15788:2808-3524(-)